MEKCKEVDEREQYNVSETILCTYIVHMHKYACTIMYIV